MNTKKNSQTQPRSKTNTNTNKYQELNDMELEIVAGGVNGTGKCWTPAEEGGYYYEKVINYLKIRLD